MSQQRIAIHYETDKTVVVHGKEVSIKPHAFIEADELLDFLKERNRRYDDDEGRLKDVSSIKILSVKIEVLEERSLDSLEDFLGITDYDEDDDDTEYRASLDDRMPSRE